MTDYDYDFCFRGIDGEECMGFIRQVRRKAFEAGKSRDKEWMADYAVSCFADNALKWSMNVHRAVLEDWDILQRALMEEYCNYNASSVDRSGSAGTTIAPAPAAAPVVTQKKNDSAMTGFIRVVAESPEAGGYVSKEADPRYRIFLTCTELADAARVRLIPLTSSYGIQLLDFPEPFCWLGITTDRLQEKGQIGPESFSNLYPRSGPASRVETPTEDPAGPARGHVWLFQSLDSCIISTWSTSNYTYILQPMVNPNNKRILVVGDWYEFIKRNPIPQYSKARLIFEPA